MNELALFAGAGGGILGGKLLGWRTVCAVEINDYCRRVLMQRQDDGILQPFPIWDDVTTFDGRPWRGRVDVVSGGFPCQDISAAGRGVGIDGDRSGLWSQMARIIGEVRPRFAFVENSPRLTSRGLDRVLGDLAELGFDAEWGVVSAADAIWSYCAPAFYHKRERIWIVAIDNSSGGRHGTAKVTIQPAGPEAPDCHCPRELQSEGQQQDVRRRPVDCAKTAANANRKRRNEVEQQDRSRTETTGQFDSDRKCPGGRGLPAGWWRDEPGVGRVVHGLANRVDRLASIGNGQVPAVAVLAWNLLKSGNR